MPHFGAGASLEGIGAVANLTELRIGVNEPTDLWALAECVHLRVLYLQIQRKRPGSGVLSLEPLSRLPELTSVLLDGRLGDVDFAPLAATPVRRLSFSTNGADISFLLRMPQLEALSIDRVTPGAATNDVLIELIRKGVWVTVSPISDTERRLNGLMARIERESDIYQVAYGGGVTFVNDESATRRVVGRLYSSRV